MPAIQSILELLQHLGLTNYWSNFHRNGIGLRELSHMTLSDLMSIGIKDASDRLALMRSIKLLFSTSNTTTTASQPVRALSEPPKLPRPKPKIHFNRSVPLVTYRHIEHIGFHNSVRERISDWSNAMQGHDFHDLGRRVKVKKIELLPIYSISVKTQYEQRAIYDGRKRDNNVSIPFFDIWKQPIRPPSGWQEESHRFALLNDENISLNHEVGIRFHSEQMVDFWIHPDIPSALLTTGGLSPALFQSKMRRNRLQRQTPFEELPIPLQRKIIEADTDQHEQLLSRYTGDVRSKIYKRIFGDIAPNKLLIQGNGFVFKPPFVEIYDQKIPPWKLILLDIHRHMGLLRRVTRQTQNWSQHAKSLRRGLKQAIDMRRHLRFEWEQLPFSNKELDLAIYGATQALVSENRIWFCNRWWTFEELQTPLNKSLQHLDIVPEALRPVLFELARTVIVKNACGSPFPGNDELPIDNQLSINNIMDSTLIHAITIEDRNIRSNLIGKIEDKALQRTVIELLDEAIPNSDSRYVKQNLEIHLLPVHRVTYLHNDNPYEFWLYGKELKYWTVTSPIHARFAIAQQIAKQGVNKTPEQSIQIVSQQMALSPHHYESYDVRQKALETIWKQIKLGGILSLIWTLALGAYSILEDSELNLANGLKIGVIVPTFTLAYMGLSSWFFRSYLDGSIQLNTRLKRVLTPLLIPAALMLTFQAQPIFEGLFKGFDSSEITDKMDSESTGVKMGSALNCNAQTLAAMSCADLELSRNEVHARHGYAFQREDLAAHFAVQNWYVPSRSFDTKDIQYSEYDKKCLNRIYKLECRRCGICMQSPSTPENTIQFQTIRELFGTSKLLKVTDPDTLSDELYPIGFTKDGNQFAYVKFEANESMNCALWTLESFDSADQRVHRLASWTDHQETECLPSPAAAFEKHRMLFLRVLTQNGIQQQSFHDIQAFPLKLNEIEHSIQIVPQGVLRRSGRVQETFALNRYEMNKEVETIGTLTKSSYAGATQIMGHQVVGYLLNPDERYMLVFVKQRQKGYLQPPDINRMMIFSATIEQN